MNKAEIEHANVKASTKMVVKLAILLIRLII